MPQNSDTAKELERKVERFISLTLKDIGTKISGEFDRNFEREAFFNEHWARRKCNDDESRGLLTRTGPYAGVSRRRLRDIAWFSAVTCHTLPFTMKVEQ